jgi:hypothetical protein
VRSIVVALEAIKRGKLTQRCMGFNSDCVGFHKKGFLKRILADPAADAAMRNLSLVTLDVEEIELSLRET